MDRFKKLGLGVAIAVVSLPSFASIDVTAVTTAMTDAGAAIGTVGAAYLAMIVGAKVFKWIKLAM